MKEQTIQDIFHQRDQEVGKCPACGHFDMILQLITNCNVCKEEIVVWDKEIKVENSCPHCTPDNQCLCKCHDEQVSDEIKKLKRVYDNLANILNDKKFYLSEYERKLLEGLYK